MSAGRVAPLEANRRCPPLAIHLSALSEESRRKNAVTPREQPRYRMIVIIVITSRDVSRRNNSRL